MLLCTLLGNVFISMKADRLFPYLKDRKVQKLPADERNNIYRNVRAMMMHKIGAVIVNNTDNLLLSSLVGIVSTSMYSNYYLIICASGVEPDVSGNYSQRGKSWRGRKQCADQKNF
jgi:hypothetical protein